MDIPIDIELPSQEEIIIQEELSNQEVYNRIHQITNNFAQSIQIFLVHLNIIPAIEVKEVSYNLFQLNLKVSFINIKDYKSFAIYNLKYDDFNKQYIFQSFYEFLNTIEHNKYQNLLESDNLCMNKYFMLNSETGIEYKVYTELLPAVSDNINQVFCQSKKSNLDLSQFLSSEPNGISQVSFLRVDSDNYAGLSLRIDYVFRNNYKMISDLSYVYKLYLERLGYQTPIAKNKLKIIYADVYLRRQGMKPDARDILEFLKFNKLF